MARKAGRPGRPRKPQDAVSAKKLGNVLIQEKIISEDQMLRAFDYQNTHGGGLKDAVTKLGFATEDDVIGALVSNLGISYFSVASYEIDPAVLLTVPAEFCIRNKLIPVSRAEDTLTVAMLDPLDVVVTEDLRSATGCTIVAAIAREAEIMEALERHYGAAAAPAAAEEEDDAEQAVAREYGEALESAQRVLVEDGVNEESAPIIRLTTRIVEDAHELGASDIHIEPFEDETIVRMRVDGLLRVHMRLPLAANRALASRFKIMAGLDIAEHRMPQDGRIDFLRFSRKGHNVDLRISTLPVAFGEKVVMRILDRKSTVLGLDAMGFSDRNLLTYRKMIRQPYGMILHVGPTGSGKTTTLYAALTEINRPELNIQTAEDPVEYMLKGINQTQMHREIGLDFARSLRAFLRQDPDVVMVGEVRDLETAQIAIEAALTGHLLFSTLHTNDAAGTVVRLIEMGIEPFLVGSSILLVCAQRLMRRLCTCKKRAKPDEAEERTFLQYGIDLAGRKIMAPGGCDACGSTGFRGRIGTHEILTMTPELHEMVNRRAPSEELQAAAVRGGMIPILQDAVEKVAEGVTSFEEAVRVVRAN